MSHLADPWPTTAEPLPRQVREQDYWDAWYEHPDGNFEWQDGQLQEVPVSDWLTGQVSLWLIELLLHYLRRDPAAELFLFEMGLRLALPGGKVSIRKPDRGLVLRDNPVQGRDRDNRYRGIPDLLIEALSDSTAANRRRDEVIKKGEYAAVGVPEYYILHHESDRLAFYTRAASGLYVPMPPQDGVIHSRVLPGFRFRPADLLRRPSTTTLRDDPVYRDFVHPEWQAAEALAEQAMQAREAAETQAAEEQRARIAAEAQAAQEQRARTAAEAEVARLKALLQQRGPDGVDD
jgi:Uma2 family endonuclease